MLLCAAGPAHHAKAAFIASSVCVAAQALLAPSASDLT